MVLLVRSYIFLATLYTMLNYVAQCEGRDVSESNSDDSEPLREALLLVKMIRTVTASNIPYMPEFISKRRMLAPSLPNEPQRPLNVSYFNNAEQREIPREYYERKMHTIMADNDGRPKVKQGRRAFYRRQDYEAYGFGTHPNATTTIASETTIAITTTTTAQPPAIITSPTAAAQDAGVTQNLKKIDITTKPKESLVTTKKKPDGIEKLSMMKIVKGQNAAQNEEEKDPILSQVESELKNEIKEVSSSHVNRAEESLFKFKRPNFHNKISTKPPTTLRIHLLSSTRYSIPLPENHALCYTDPENGLCRTPI